MTPESDVRLEVLDAMGLITPILDRGRRLRALQAYHRATVGE